MTTKQRVRQFIVENFFVPDPSELGDDTTLVGRGYVDSTGMLEVIGFLEDEFAIAVADRDITPENLDTVARITSFVDRKRATAPAAADGQTPPPDYAHAAKSTDVQQRSSTG